MRILDMFASPVAAAILGVVAAAMHIAGPFDAYCVVEDPRGGRFSLMEGGTILPGVVPFARGVAVGTDAAVVRLFQAPLPGGMIPGRYTVTLGIADPGAKPSLAAARAWRQDRLEVQ